MIFGASREKHWTLCGYFLVSALFVTVAVAQAASPAKNITSDDFDLIKEMFSHRECDIPKFFEVSKALGLVSTWRQFDDSPDEPVGQLADLGSESLCLIAMSSSFQAYRHKPPNKDGIVYSDRIGPKDVFPKDANVSELVFFLPKSLAPKKCVTFEGPLVPYVIIIEKKDGKLVRRIDRTDADEDCFIAALKKKGAIPRNLPVSQK
jgi:hypothetical protein